MDNLSLGAAERLGGLHTALLIRAGLNLMSSGLGAGEQQYMKVWHRFLLIVSSPHKKVGTLMLK